MAAIVALRQLYERLGLSQAAARHIIDVQGIDSLQEIGYLDEDGISNLCKAVRRPGGSIANPDHDPNEDDGPNNRPTIPFTGIQVSLLAEENLKLLSYYIRHLERVSRTPNIGSITRTTVRKLRELRAAEANHENPSITPKIDDRNWAKTLEGLEEYLRGHLGETKVPLAYVLRPDPTIPDEADDPSTTEAESQYATYQEEMIKRAPINNDQGDDHPTFQQDNHRVWSLISELLRDHKCWAYVKSFQRSRDGREAIKALRSHYLGSNMVNDRAAEAEAKLQSARYYGEKKRWNFESYVTIHKAQHQVMRDLKEFGYQGMDPGTQVRHLMHGIKTKELDAAKAQILASPILQNKFDACVDLFKGFIAQAKNQNATLNISLADTNPSNPRDRRRDRPNRHHNGKRKRDDDTSDEVEDRYYTPKEYNELSHKQKEKLKKLRLKRERKVAQAVTEIADLKKQLSEMKATAADKDKSSNRNNPALTRNSKQNE